MNVKKNLVQVRFLVAILKFIFLLLYKKKIVGGIFKLHFHFIVEVVFSFLLCVNVHFYI